MPRVRSKVKSRGSNLDKVSVREFRLYAMNDYQTYRQLEAFAKNYAKKRVKKRYNKTLAIQGLANSVVPRILAKYKKDYGMVGSVSSAGKKKVAQGLLYDIEELIQWEMNKLKAKKKK
jgi:hypothetical protein